MNSLRRYIVAIAALVGFAITASAQGTFYPPELGDPQTWQAMPAWLSARADHHPVTATAEGLEFRIAEPARGMKWLAAVSGVDAGELPYLVIRYRCRNYQTQTDYLLWLRDDAHRSGLYLLAKDDISADGRWHTLAIDLAAYGVASVSQLAVQCFATDAGDARLTISRLEFTDAAPEGAQLLPRRAAGGLLARLPFNDPSAWKAQRTWLSNPAEDCAVTRTKDGLRFYVGEAGKGMKWSCDLAKELPGGYFKLRYRAVGLQPRNDYALYAAVSGGGRSEREQYVFKLNELQADGDWHVAVAFYNAELVRALAIQVQAVRAGAWIEVSGIEIWGTRPAVTIGEVCTYSPKWPQDLASFRPLTLPDPARPRKLQRALGFSGWFDTPRITVQGIPFDVGRGGLLSQWKDIGWMEVQVRGPYAQLYLLLAARLPSTEVPSYRRKPAKLVLYPHRFVVEIRYADGRAERQMPTCLPSGQPCVASGIRAYALATDPQRPIARLRLYDGHRRGAFALLALTGSTKPGPATEATAPVRAPVLTPASRRSEAQRCRVSDDSLTVDSGALHLSLSTRTGLELAELRSDYLPHISPVADAGPLFTISLGDKSATSAQAAVRRVARTGPASANVLLDFSPTVPLSAELDISAAAIDEVRLALRLRAQGELVAEPRVSFPVLKGGRAENRPGQTWGFYPRRGTVISNQPFAASLPVGGIFPLQVMGFFRPTGGGVYVRTEYQRIVDRRYAMELDRDGRVTMEVLYPWWRGEPLNAVIGTHPGDWHDQLAAYDSWRRTWFKPAAPRKDWFRRVFNFRQQFLTFAVPRKSGMFDPATKQFHIMDVLERDCALFGGVDFLHLFDWGWSPKHGRCGDYAPWDYLGGVDNFRQAIEQVQQHGIPVGLYIEGYLVSPKSTLFQRAKPWQVITRQGHPLQAFAPEINMCPWVQPWQQYLAGVYRRVRQQTGAMGYYIDEYGFAGDNHACYSPAHGHPRPVYAAAGELQMVKRVRAAVGPQCALYTEETPCDVTMQWQDGSFTYAISSVEDHLSPHHLNLVRFAVPDFKTIEIIVCDRPLGDNLEALKRIAFNGEAIWLEGTPELWFDERTLYFLWAMHAVLTAYVDCFTSLHPEPLVPTLWQGLWANRFPSDDGKRCVWTLYWTGPRTLSGELIAVPHRSGARYREEWQGRRLKVRRDGAQDVISAYIHPHEVLVIAQQVGE